MRTLPSTLLALTVVLVVAADARGGTRAPADELTDRIDDDDSRHPGAPAVPDPLTAVRAR